MDVRDADEREIEALARIWYDGWHESHAPIVPAELTRLRTLESFRDRLRAARPAIRVAGPAGAPLGFCIVKGDELYQLFVSAEARGSGVAASLIADAEARLAATGVRTAWLACAIGNERAARFYEKRGWRRTGTMVNRCETKAGTFPLEVWRYEKALVSAAGVRSMRVFELPALLGLVLVPAVMVAQGTKVSPAKFAAQPLVRDIYTADPSAHVFGGKIYIYPSHDIEAGVKPDDLGSHFAMRDYHVFSMDAIGGRVTDHGIALDIKDVPWAGRQMWAPDAAEKDGRYYFYFPAKDKHDVFRIGAAVGTSPAGPFAARPQPIEGSYSIDPAVFKDTDGAYYMYFGGIWGGQLQRWASGTYRPEDVYPASDQAALSAKVARLGDDMVSFAHPPRDVIVQDETGAPLKASDTGRRFFEAAWMHKYNGTYYFSYSTGDTHFLVYATGKSPHGPFVYRGRILEPVLGWTTHHSIVEFAGKWYLFYHDAQLSGGQTHLRNIKVAELTHREDGSIATIDPYLE